MVLEPTVRDFFISYTRQDRAWAEWIAWTLEENGHSVYLQAWDFRPGSNFALEIDRSATDSRKTLLVLTPAYLAAKFPAPEWAAAFVQDPQGLLRRLIPVRVEPCEPDGLLAPIIPVDLVGLPPEQAKAELLAGLRDRVKPEAEPGFPGRSPRMDTGRAPARVVPREVPYPGAVPLPRQLPAPPADFVGREEELKHLLAAAAAGGRVAIFGLRGLGGVGKTALALRLAEELAPGYPDGHIFLDLQGVTDPLSPAQAMAHTIRAFLPETRPPDDSAELAGLYRSVLHGRRVLLLMDNARDGAQVEPLLPPAGCALLITSRIHFHLPGATTRDLGELPEEDARALLLAITPRLGEQAGPIATLCGRLPFALRLAGGALADRSNLSPAVYAQSLERAQQRFERVDASLALSLDLLREDRRPLWCRLAVFPASFDEEAAAAVWELAPDPARDALGELVAYSLVEWEQGRYRLHDLARLFARNRLDPAGRVEIERRHAHHYLSVLKSANSLYLKGGAALLKGLHLFNAEWLNIQAGQAWAAMGAAKDPFASWLCDAYPAVGIHCLALRLHPREQIRWLEVALEAARRRGNRDMEGTHLGNLGLAYAALGETRHAIKIYEQSLSIARDIGNRRGEGKVLNSLGNAYAALGEPRRAIDLYEQHLTIARDIGDRRDEGYALNNMGNAYADLGEPRRAIDFYEQHLDIARDTGDRSGEGNTLNNLGLAYANIGEMQRAIDLYEQRLVIARDIGDRGGEGSTLNNLGTAYAILGEARRAIDFYEQHLAIARDIGDRSGEGNALDNLGSAYRALDEPRRAIHLFEQHLAIARDIGDRRGEGNALNNMGLACADLGETRRAIDLYEQRLAIARDIGDRHGEALGNWNLGQALEKEGDLERALALMQFRVTYAREIGHP